MRLKQNASNKGGAQVNHAGGRGVTGRSKMFDCSAHHISTLVQELRENGVALANTSGQVQNATLRKVLAYLGPRGRGTYEGAAAGYPRLAARIKDLRSAGWPISTRRENLIGPDDLHHQGGARYFLMAQHATNEGTPC